MTTKILIVVVFLIILIIISNIINKFFDLIKTFNENKINDWICSDPDSNQYIRKINDMTYELKEDRYDPESKKIKVYNSIIKLAEYSNEEMIHYCMVYGYRKTEIEIWLRAGENLDIIAECIFEQEN